MTDFIDIIQRKRDGQALSDAEINDMIAGYMSGEMADYQMSAWLMAAFLEGLNLRETLALTDAMISTGEVIDLSSLGVTVVDKHSTGGVGDKVSIVLGPVVAACGAVFGKMSGRGLGHTGGTVDKLESIPGFQTTIGRERFVSQLAEVGICIAGQSPELVPADDRLYELRDVTATVDSNPLTAASIMSKKIAAGADVVVLDVKVGQGAFFKNRGQASGVAHLMQELGQARGLEVAVLMTAMEQPLGHAVGNAIEVREAVAALKGHGPPDLTAVVMALAAELLSRSGQGWDREHAADEAGRSISDGRAFARFREWIIAQGGDTVFIDDDDGMPLAEHRQVVTAPEDGFVSGLDALAVGRAVLDLGAGRKQKGAGIDHGVGVSVHAKVGDRVERGQEIAVVYARSPKTAASAASAVADAYSLSGEQVHPLDLIISTL